MGGYTWTEHCPGWPLEEDSGEATSRAVTVFILLLLLVVVLHRLVVLDVSIRSRLFLLLLRLLIKPKWIEAAVNGRWGDGKFTQTQEVTWNATNTNFRLLRS